MPYNDPSKPPRLPPLVVYRVVGRLKVKKTKRGRVMPRSVSPLVLSGAIRMMIGNSQKWGDLEKGSLKLTVQGRARQAGLVASTEWPLVSRNFEDLLAARDRYLAQHPHAKRSTKERVRLPARRRGQGTAVGRSASRRFGPKGLDRVSDAFHLALGVARRQAKPRWLEDMERGAYGDGEASRRAFDYGVALARQVLQGKRSWHYIENLLQHRLHARKPAVRKPATARTRKGAMARHGFRQAA
jgi:hypothetical protein